jgi:uncharacterized protein (TIRG00374 family)
VSEIEPTRGLVGRSRTWLAWSVAIAALLYVAFSAFAGFGQVRGALAAFQWSYAIPVLGLTLVNYVLRGWKWDYLLRRLGVVVPLREQFLLYVAGLAMVISPAKAGELLKPYLVRARTGAPMARTIPALATERLTDGIACLLLAAVGVGRYAGESASLVYALVAASALGVPLLVTERGERAVLYAASWVPGGARVRAKLGEALRAMRTCASPVPMLVTVAVSLAAWFAECVGYQLVFAGFGRDVDLGIATFLYAFATVLGGAMPGGLGVADSALAYGAPPLIPGLPLGEALAASLLIRVATLWFGVVLGAFALTRVGGWLDAPSSPPS